MKFTCDKHTILDEISIAQEIISSRNALSVLSNVFLEVNDNTLLIKATDLKVGFESKIPVEVKQPGSTTVFSDKFLSILRALPDGDVEFEQVENNFIINPVFGSIDFKLKSIASDKFPELQQISGENFFNIAQKDLIEMISQTSFAVSDDETRYFMNGVYLENQENDLVMVATDGRRLSLIRKTFNKLDLSFSPVIIPPKVLHLVKKLCSGEGEVAMAVTDKHVFFEFDNQKLSSNLIEGQFPNYNRVIPEKQDNKILIEKEKLVEALKRVSLLVEQRSRRIYFNIQNNNLVLSSEESEIGIAKEEIPCKFEGPETTIALNYVYLSDPLKVIDDNNLVIEFSEANKAISLTPSGKAEYVHIIMPMQLD